MDDINVTSEQSSETTSEDFSTAQQLVAVALTGAVIAATAAGAATLGITVGNWIADKIDDWKLDRELRKHNDDAQEIKVTIFMPKEQS